MQILMPIAAESPFFPEADYFFPKPLVDVNGKPMVEWVVEALKTAIPDAQFIFVLAEDLSRRFSLDKTLKLLAGTNTKIIEYKNETGGGLCTALLSIDICNHNAPLLIVNSDQVISADLQGEINYFRASKFDAALLTFESVHPRWSYVIADTDGFVEQVVEKRVISNMAIAGTYYFQTAGTFFDAARAAILIGDHTNNQFYLSSAINQVLLKNLHVGYSQIDSSQYFCMYAPDKVAEFSKSNISQQTQNDSNHTCRINVVIPAAGTGSRFQDNGWKKPKPFIDVNGQMMLSRVMENLTVRGFHAAQHLLLRREHLNNFPSEASELQNACAKIHVVDRLTEGTACTLLLARKDIDNDKMLMVANSDQLVNIDMTAFVDDCIERDLDGSILVFRDEARDPKWSFAKLAADGLVEAVAEKTPISDCATVGIYLFRRGSEFVNAAIDMIANNDRVNNEFYTCPVYNYMIDNGCKIGVYEIPYETMNGLGTPDDLTTYLRGNNFPPSADIPG
ncbi:MAG: glycosyltransferase family 2 protein [Alphaproteobacteria bacterium]